MNKVILIGKEASDMPETVNVSYNEFLQELQGKLKYFSNGGTSYRERTAVLALNAALKTGKVSPFLKLDVSNQTVSHLMPNMDRYRKEDVAKMLYSVVKHLSINANLTDEEKLYIKDTMENLKPLAFVKK